MSDSVRIVGICLVKNEEVYIDQVLANTVEFCDELMIADNNSTDDTYQIAEQWAEKHDCIRLHRVESPGVAHSLVRPYSGTRTWIFAVDGDELYDPDGLAVFRRQLLDGHASVLHGWVILGNKALADVRDRDDTVVVAVDGRERLHDHGFLCLAHFFP